MLIWSFSNGNVGHRINDITGSVEPELVEIVMKSSMHYK